MPKSEALSPETFSGYFPLVSGKSAAFRSSEDWRHDAAFSPNRQLIRSRTSTCEFGDKRERISGPTPPGHSRKKVRSRRKALVGCAEYFVGEKLNLCFIEKKGWRWVMFALFLAQRLLRIVGRAENDEFFGCRSLHIFLPNNFFNTLKTCKIWSKLCFEPFFLRLYVYSCIFMYGRKNAYFMAKKCWRCKVWCLYCLSYKGLCASLDVQKNNKFLDAEF